MPKFLQDIDTEIDRMNRLVENMLQLTRLEEDEIAWPCEPQDVNAIINHVISLEQGKANAREVELKADFPGGVRWPVNRDLLTCALFNLLDNALRHTPPGGEVVVAGGIYGKELVISVADNGEGIPEEALPKIFDRFYRVDKARARATGGTGLGLAIVREAVQRQKGTVTVSSRPDKGTVFTLTFIL